MGLTAQRNPKHTGLPDMMSENNFHTTPFSIPKNKTRWSGVAGATPAVDASSAASPLMACEAFPPGELSFGSSASSLQITAPAQEVAGISPLTMLQHTIP